jgi:hypothetical protein
MRFGYDDTFCLCLFRLWLVHRRRGSHTGRPFGCLRPLCFIILLVSFWSSIPILYISLIPFRSCHPRFRPRCSVRSALAAASVHNSIRPAIATPTPLPTLNSQPVVQLAQIGTINFMTSAAGNKQVGQKDKTRSGRLTCQFCIPLRSNVDWGSTYFHFSLSLLACYPSHTTSFVSILGLLLSIEHL